MDKNDVELAIHWNAVCGYSLQTIAQHFGVGVETLKCAIRNRVPSKRENKEHR